METSERIECTTERLLLRPYREEDWKAVQVYGGNAEICQYQPWGPNTEEQTIQFVRECIQENNAVERTVFHFAILLKEQRLLIGGCTLRITNPVLREAMIGYTIDRPYWGHGYTTEAVRSLLALAFNDLLLHRVTSWCTPENIGSWRVMEKAGMRREGHEREAVFFKERWHDWYRYAILCHEAR